MAVPGREGVVIKSPIQSIDRAVTLLEAMADAGAEGLSLTEIARRSELNVSTTHSLLTSLVANGLAVLGPAPGMYRLGPRAFQLTRAYLNHSSLLQVALPRAEALGRATEETVFVSTLVNRARVDLVQLIGRRVLSINPAAYHRGADNLHSSSVGKVLMAGLGDAEVRDVLGSGELAAWTAATVTDPAEVLRGLDQVRRLGYASNDEETDVGVCGVAAPVKDAEGKWIGAVCIAYPAARRTTEYSLSLRSAVLEAAAMVSTDLGHGPDS